MIERLKTLKTRALGVLLSHRVLYGGLAAAYAADCLFGVDKELVEQGVMTLYVLLMLRG